MTVERAAAWARARQVLAVRLDAMGDVLMTTPALRALRTTLREASVTLLTSPAGAAAAAHVPEVDRTIVGEASWMKAGREPDPAGDLALVERLCEGRFDAAVIFTVRTQSALPAALVCRMAGIPLRLGHSRENPYALLTDWVPDPESFVPTRHEVRRQLDLVAAVGCTVDDPTLSFRVPPRAARHVRAIAAGLGLTDDRPWAVIHPGASAPSRRYAPDRFAAAGGELANRHGWRFVVTGSEAEAGLVERVVAGINEAAGVAGAAVPLAGRLDLGELGALLAIAPLLISNNSGPVHLAAAVGTPVVDLYALTNPQHTPWGVPHRVLSRDVPCRGCLQSVCPLARQVCLDVDPADVVAAALELGASLPVCRPSLARGVPA